MTVRHRAPAAPMGDRAGGAPAGGDRDFGEVFRFLQSLWSVDHAFESASKRLERATGVTGSQRLVLRIVSGMPGVGPGEVAAMLRVHASTLTGVLQRLEEHGLLLRTRDDADARRAHLYLTERGRALAGVRAASAEMAVGRALGRLSPGTVAMARKVLDAVASELGRPGAWQKR